MFESRIRYFETLSFAFEDLVPLQPREPGRKNSNNNRFGISNIQLIPHEINNNVQLQCSEVALYSSDGAEPMLRGIGLCMVVWILL